MIIYPIQSLHPENRTCVPISKSSEKLLQYIGSKFNRLRNEKLRKVHFHPLLKDFIDSYLVDQRDKNGEIFFFEGKDAQKKSEDFLKQLNEFSAKHPNAYRYPKEYI